MLPVILLALAVAVAAVVAGLPPVPQDLTYHGFADRAALLGVPNFWNVVSNLPFLLVGTWGLAQRPIASVDRQAYLLLCAGTLLVGAGSSAYHLAPSNATLVWDRLPMTIAFMALFAIVIGDRVSPGAGRRLLWPLVAAGILSVLYWAWTEQAGRGDLRPYGLVQFLPMLMIPVMLLGAEGRGLKAAWLWATLGAYGVAKLAEHYDAAIHAATAIIGGHPLKHLVAALAVCFALQSLRESGDHRA